jgi:hypothetical protein
MMMTILRIEVVILPPGIFAMTYGWVTAPAAINNAMDRIQYINVLLQSDLAW